MMPPRGPYSAGATFSTALFCIVCTQGLRAPSGWTMPYTVMAAVTGALMVYFYARWATFGAKTEIPDGATSVLTMKCGGTVTITRDNVKNESFVCSRGCRHEGDAVYEAIASRHK